MTVGNGVAVGGKDVAVGAGVAVGASVGTAVVTGKGVAVAAWVGGAVGAIVAAAAVVGTGVAAAVVGAGVLVGVSPQLARSRLKIIKNAKARRFNFPSFFWCFYSVLIRLKIPGVIIKAGRVCGKPASCFGLQ